MNSLNASKLIRGDRSVSGTKISLQLVYVTLASTPLRSISTMVVDSSDEFTCTKQFCLDSKEKNYYYDLMYNFLDLLRLTLCVTNSDFFPFRGRGLLGKFLLIRCSFISCQEFCNNLDSSPPSSPPFEKPVLKQEVKQEVKQDKTSTEPAPVDDISAVEDILQLLKVLNSISTSSAHDFGEDGETKYFQLVFLSVYQACVIGQFSGRYSTARPSRIHADFFFPVEIPILFAAYF